MAINSPDKRRNVSGIDVEPRRESLLPDSSVGTADRENWAGAYIGFDYTGGSPVVIPTSALLDSFQFEGDIRLLFEDGLGTIEVEDGDLIRDAGLETAILLSIFTDKRATQEAVEIAGVSDLRGWWGDGFSGIAGDQIGSFLWLLERAKIVPQMLTQAESYIRDALAWMLEDGLVKSISASVIRAGLEGIQLDIIVQRPERSEVVTFKYYYNWKAQEIRRLPDAVG